MFSNTSSNTNEHITDWWYVMILTSAKIWLAMIWEEMKVWPKSIEEDSLPTCSQKWGFSNQTLTMRMWHLIISGGQKSDHETWQDQANVPLPPTHVHTVSPCGKCSQEIQTPLWLQLHIWLWVFWSDERGPASDSGLCSAQSGFTSDREWNEIYINEP